MIAEYQVYETEVYTKWFVSLNDERAKARIAKRIDRAKYGNRTSQGGIRNEFET